MVVAFLVLSALAAVPPAGAAESSAWPTVPPVDTSRLKPSDFADDELDLPYHLFHFHHVANAVVPSGENRGFIDVPVWRARRDNAPYNARIMESVLSLAWFYTARRPWNPYYGAPEVRVRLEAALDFWCRSQHVDGRFSEYGPGEWGLAPTAFATKFMGETLTLLEGGPPIDPAVLARARAADRKAIEAVLSLPALYDHGRRFTNQYTNVYAGGLAYLHLYPDRELEARLEARIRETSALFQSPAGYFYEQTGPDYSYNLGTHQSNLRMALHYAKGSALGPVFIDEGRRFFEWLAYNAVPEPDGNGFTINRGIETRQQMPYLDRRRGDRRGAPPEEAVEAYPFLPTREEQAASITAQRETLERDWPRVPDLDLQRPSAFTPYSFLHRRHSRFLPTQSQRDAAVARLPVWRSERFVHQRADDREGVAFTYVRRPRYYAAFNSGRQLTAQQRYGLGLVWTPRAGAVLQSQTGPSDAAWGTLVRGGAVYEAGDLAAELRLGNEAVEARAGARDLDGGADKAVEARYRLDERGRKRVVFDHDEIRVRIDHADDFVERIPLLVAPGDSVQGRVPRFVLTYQGRPAVVVTLVGARHAEIVRHVDPVGAKTLWGLSVDAEGRLDYTLAFPPPEGP